MKKGANMGRRRGAVAVALVGLVALAACGGGSSSSNGSGNNAANAAANPANNKAATNTIELRSVCDDGRTEQITAKVDAADGEQIELTSQVGDAAPTTKQFGPYGGDLLITIPAAAGQTVKIVSVKKGSTDMSISGDAKSYAMGSKACPAAN